MADAPSTAPKAKAPKSKAPKEKAAKVAPAAPAEPAKVARKPTSSKPRHGRLYAKAVFTGYKRGLRNQHENTALLKVSSTIEYNGSTSTIYLVIQALAHLNPQLPYYCCPNSTTVTKMG